jgi:hypothetical protein
MCKQPFHSRHPENEIVFYYSLKILQEDFGEGDEIKVATADSGGLSFSRSLRHEISAVNNHPHPRFERVFF